MIIFAKNLIAMKMKTITLSFLTIFTFILTGFAQVITTQPAFPTADAAVTITFNATGTAMAGYTGDVYAHTGVNIQGVGNWQHVIGSWGNNQTQPQLTRIAANTYTLSITPTIRQFYGASAQAVIQKMAFVFRAAPGAPQTVDLFVDVYAPGLNLNISAPANGSIVELNQQVNIQAQSNTADSMFIYLNADLLHKVAGTSISKTITATDPGSQWIFVKAKKDNEIVHDSVYFFARGAAPVAALPAGVVSGINYINNQTVTLVLHDPPALKQYVFVLGDFNNWLVDEAYYMNRTPDGKYYWLTINNLTPGAEYIFQYYIDGSLKIADPYTEKISDPWNDKWIPASNYPGLIPYPEGKTTGIASVLQTAQIPYNWEITQFTAPANKDLVIYELHIRDFLASRDIKDLIDTLDYLENLGVNAIELMPINEFEGNDSWGYNPSFYFASDKAYGRKQDYQQFIDECHKRGIAVIIDMVLNHSYGQSPLIQMYSKSNYWEPASNNPWYNEYCPHEPWCWGADFNHLSPYTQDFVDRVNAFWLTEFKVDGFRFDFTKGFTNVQSGNQGWNRDNVRISLLKRMADKIWEVNPNAYVILEHFTDNSEEKELAEYGMLVWGNMYGSYRDAIRGSNPSSDFNWVSYKQRNWNVPHLIGYYESHDEQRQMYENLQNGNSSNAAHNIRTLPIALKRMELAAAFFYTIPGPKMLWQFGELGYDVDIDYNGRVGAKPVRWQYYSDYRRKYLYDMSASLIKLRQQEPVFSTSDFTLATNTAAKRISLSHASMNAIVIGNFDVQAAMVSPAFPHTGWWYSYFPGDSVNVLNVNVNVVLQPGEYRIYTNKKLTKPDIGTSIFEVGKPTNLDRMKILYDPENNGYHVVVNLVTSGVIQLSLVDLSGREIAIITQGQYGSGLHEFKLNGSQLKAGVNLLKLNTDQGVQTEKVIIF